MSSTHSLTPASLILQPLYLGLHKLLFFYLFFELTPHLFTDTFTHPHSHLFLSFFICAILLPLDSTILHKFQLSPDMKLLPPLPPANNWWKFTPFVLTLRSLVVPRVALVLCSDWFIWCRSGPDWWFGMTSLSRSYRRYFFWFHATCYFLASQNCQKLFEVSRWK